jgi:hypothetical protein
MGLPCILKISAAKYSDKAVGGGTEGEWGSAALGGREESGSETGVAIENVRMGCGKVSLSGTDGVIHRGGGGYICEPPRSLLDENGGGGLVEGDDDIVVDEW